MTHLTFAAVMASSPQPIVRGWFDRLTPEQQKELVAVRKEWQRTVDAPPSHTFAKAIKKVSTMKLPHHRTLAEWLRNDS